MQMWPIQSVHCLLVLKVRNIDLEDKSKLKNENLRNAFKFSSFDTKAVKVWLMCYQ